MKLKKKIAFIIFAIFIIGFIFCKNTSTADNEVDRYYFSSTNTVEDGLLEIDVIANTSGADLMSGVIKYDAALDLKKIEKNFPSQFSTNSVEPKVSQSGEVIQEISNATIERGKEIVVFGAFGTEDDSFNGKRTILKLYFDISNCEAGKQYGLSWHIGEGISDEQKLTRMSYNKTDKTLDTQSYIFTMPSGEEEEESDEEAAAKAAAEKAAAEKAAAEKAAAEKAAAEKAAAEKEAAEKAAAEKAAAEKAAAEKAAAEKAAAEKAAAEKAAAEKAATEKANASKNNANATNSAASNKENLPQTGSAYTFIISGAIMIAIAIGTIGYMNIKKIKK